MSKYPVLILLAFSFTLTGSISSYGQTVRAQAIETQKEEIRRLHNTTQAAYKKIHAEATRDKELKYLAKTQQQITKYYDRALMLEKNGRYKEAEVLCKKALTLCRDLRISPYIKKKNYELKSLAKKNRSLLKNKIAGKKRPRKRIKDKKQSPTNTEPISSRSARVKELENIIIKLENE